MSGRMTGKRGAACMSAALLALVACGEPVAPSLVAAIDIEQVTVTLDAVNGVSALAVAIRDAAGRSIPNPGALAWTTGNADVATVDANGVVMARAQGDAYVRVAYQHMKDSVLVRVRAEVAFSARLQDIHNGLIDEAGAQADVSVVVQVPMP